MNPPGGLIDVGTFVGIVPCGSCYIVALLIKTDLLIVSGEGSDDSAGFSAAAKEDQMV